MVQMKKCPGTAAVCRPGQAHFVRTLIYQFLEGMKKMKKVYQCCWLPFSYLRWQDAAEIVRMRPLRAEIPK